MMAGKLDRRIRLERPVRAIAPDGSAMTTKWEAVATVWATVTPVSARERLAAPQVIPEQTAKVWIRHREDVHPSWRIIHAGKPWGIVGVSEVGRREGLELLVVAVEVKG